MPVLSVRNLGMAFGERTLFSGVSFDVEKNEKLGFIGRNGVGKTTLFKILIGELSPTAGTIAIERGLKLGYMEQHACNHPERTLYEELVGVFAPLIEMERQIADVTAEIDAGNSPLDELVERQTHLIEEFERQDGLTYKSRTRASLIGLGFTESEFSMPVRSLSGGQRSKLSLLKLLLSNPGLMLLDEPTNHLDIASVSWLESFLRDYRGAMIIISHDRYFLDAVTVKTVELEHERSICYKGNYSEFLIKKEAYNIALENKFENDMREIHRLEGIIAQQKRWNRERNLRTAASKQKQLDKIKEGLVAPDSALETMRMRFEPRFESGNDVLMAHGLAKSFGDKRLFRDVDVHLTKGERVFILGENGCGKTTLFRLLTGAVPPDRGEGEFGVGVELGYYDQMQENLNLNNTAIDEIWNTYPRMSETAIRSAMAAFLFKGDEVYKPLSQMSGGERARVSLLKLMLGGANLLLLDEPTNHLDASSREALEDTLAEFSGTMLIISHDRYFINKLADRILVLTPDGMREYLGNYDDYLERTAQENAPAPSPEKTEKPQKPLNEYQLRKQRESEERKRRTRLRRAEEEIERLERAIADAEAALGDEAVISDYEKLLELTASLEELNAVLEEQYAIWEENAEGEQET